MGIRNKTDLLIALLYADNKKSIEGITRLEKMLFLLKEEEGFLSNSTKEENFNFTPFKMGPWSQEVYDELDFLESLGLLEKRQSANQQEEDSTHDDELFDSIALDKYQVDKTSFYENKTEKFQLSEKAFKIAEKMWTTRINDEERKKIEQLKKKYNSMNLKQFLRYVYRKYPRYTSKSEIKDYLGF